MDFSTRSQIQRRLEAFLHPEAGRIPAAHQEAESGNEDTQQELDSHEEVNPVTQHLFGGGQDTDNEEDSQSNNEASQNDQPEPERISPPFPPRGKTVLQNSDLNITVREISHQRYSRFNVGDHLYSIRLRPTDRTNMPLIANIEDSLQQALIRVLNSLKESYPQEEDFQVYLTILGKDIRGGLNSGNYSLRTPSHKIVRWMLSMLYNYLKSNQTMRLDNSFHVKIKVLSMHHTNDLVRRRRMFRKHVYH